MDFYKRKVKQKSMQPTDTLKKEVSILQDQVGEVLKLLDKEAAVKVAICVDDKIAEYDKIKEKADFVEKQKILGLIDELRGLKENLDSVKEKRKLPIPSPRIFIDSEKKDITLIAGNPVQGKVEVNEIQENLKRMRQKRLSRLSRFVDEQQRLAEQRNENGLEIEDAIKAFQKTSPMPRLKSIVQDKIIGKTFRESMESIGESSSGFEEHTEENEFAENKLNTTQYENEIRPQMSIGKSTLARKSVEPGQIPPSPKMTKALDLPKTPSPGMRKLFSTFGACAATDISSDEEDSSYNKNISIENIIGTSTRLNISSPLNMDHLYAELKSKPKEFVSRDLSLSLNDSFKEQLQEPRVHPNSKRYPHDPPLENFSVENPLYGRIPFNENHQLLQGLLNKCSALENIIRNDCEDIQRYELDNILETVEEAQTFLSKIQMKIVEKLKKNQVESMEKYRRVLNEISDEIKHFKGLRRDIKYLVLSNKLTNLYSEVVKVRSGDNIEEIEKREFLEGVDFLVKILEDRVEKNEKTLKRVLEEQVIALGLTSLDGTEV